MEARTMVVLALLVAASSAAVAKERRPPMPVAHELQVELNVQHPRFEADISGLNRAIADAAGPGLIAMAAGNSDFQHREEADRRAETLEGKLAGYPFLSRMETRLRADFSATGLSPHPAFSTVGVGGEVVAGAQCGERKQVFALTPRYWMSANFLELTIELNARHVDRRVGRNGECVDEQSFQRSYAWRYQMPKVKGMDASGNAQRWNQIDRQRLFDMLDQGVVQVVALMNYDYSAAGRLEDEQIRYGVSAAPKPEGAIVKQGWVGAFDGIPGLVGMVPVDWHVPPSPFGNP